MLAASIVVLGVCTALIIHYATGTPLPAMVGILSGAVTNTPGLGAAQQTYSDTFGTAEPSIALGYAVAYPSVGVSYKPEITTTLDEETLYPKGNGSIRVMESDCPNARKIVLVGDSFRDAAVPFLPKEFSHAVSIHRDAITEPDALKAISELGEGDVLWLLAVERYDMGNAYAADVILKGLD